MVKKHKKLKIAALSVVLVITCIFAIRTINTFRYANTSTSEESIDVQDMQAYPLEYENLSIRTLKQNRLNGFHIVPKEKTHSGIVVTLGGSEGGCNYFEGIKLAQEGYEVASLFYFGQSNQPKQLNLVPLEFFSDFLSYALSNNIDTDMLTIVGGSKGAELALLLASKYEQVDNVVLYSPSSHIFQGLETGGQTSSWTFYEQELPFISFYEASGMAVAKMMSAIVLNYPISLCPLYESALQNSEKSIDAKIDVTKFQGNILTLAGEQDAMWPSSLMAQEIYEANPNHTTQITFSGVGHVFAPIVSANGLSFGGTIEKNAQAEADSYAAVLKFLNTYHK